MGRGKCRSSDGTGSLGRPGFFYRTLDPFFLKIDDSHGYCRDFCNQLKDDCLGYVFHIEGSWKYTCALYVLAHTIDDFDSSLWTYEPSSNEEEPILDLTTVQAFDSRNTYGFCFIKALANKPEIKKTCIQIYGFQSFVINPPNINDATIVECKSFICIYL